MEELLQKLNAYWDSHEATEEDGGLMFFNENDENDYSEGFVEGIEEIIGLIAMISESLWQVW